MDSVDSQALNLRIMGLSDQEPGTAATVRIVSLVWIVRIVRLVWIVQIVSLVWIVWIVRLVNTS